MEGGKGFDVLTIGVWASVGHAEQAFGIEREGEVLVGEVAAVDGLTAGSIALGEVWSDEQGVGCGRRGTHLRLGS